MERTIFSNKSPQPSPDISPITPPDKTPSRTPCYESDTTNSSRLASMSMTPTPLSVEETSTPQEKKEDLDYEQIAPAGPNNSTGSIIHSTDYPEEEENCTYQEFANSKFVRVGVIEGLDAIEKDQSPNERSRLRMFRAAPTESFPKITTDRSEAVVKLLKEQRRENYFRNMSNWVLSAKQDGVDFDIGDTVGDFDHAERMEQARQNIATKMIRDDFGVWRLKLEVDEGADAVINGHSMH